MKSCGSGLAERAERVSVTAKRVNSSAVKPWPIMDAALWHTR